MTLCVSANTQRDDGVSINSQRAAMGGFWKDVKHVYYGLLEGRGLLKQSEKVF